VIKRTVQKVSKEFAIVLSRTVSASCFKSVAKALLIIATLGSGTANAGFYDGNDVTFQYYAYGGTNGSPVTFVVPGSTTFF